MKYYITETQYKSLIEQKRTKKIVNRILEEIERNKKNLNEGVMLNEALVDTLRKYLKKGLLTTAVIGSLLASNKVNAQDLLQAGVSPNQIEIAQQGEQVNPKAVERAIVNNLRRAGQKGTLEQFQSLDQQTKTNMINTIVNQTGGDLGKLRNMDISLYLNKASELGGDQYTKIGQKKTINVDTVFVDVVRDYGTEFDFNSAKLKNPEETKQEFQKYLNAFNNIEKITIVASSSTLRNTGEMEGTTWKQSSQMRVDVIKDLLIGMEFNLGGCGLNESHSITEDMINQNIDGTNGDGTSGPQSPFEVDGRMVDSYNERGIDPSLWKSAAEEAPLFDIEEIRRDKSLVDQYKQYQYVKVVITGDVVETQTNEIINIDYLKLEAKRDGTTIKKNPKGKQQNVKVLSCPVKF
jgi:hypothetical protein